jgi:hypothetical protein
MVISYTTVEWSRHVERRKEMWNSFVSLVGKFQGKRPLERPSFRSQDSVTIDIREVWC